MSFASGFSATLWVPPEEAREAACPLSPPEECAFVHPFLAEDADLDKDIPLEHAKAVAQRMIRAKARSILGSPDVRWAAAVVTAIAALAAVAGMGRSGPK
jgi:hypothetical protein